MIRILTFILLALCATGCEPQKKASPAKGKTSAKAKAGRFSAKVVAVHDGDTCTVYDGRNPQMKVRLAEIDAPELKQPWGQRSKEALSKLIFGRTVQITPISKDRYGRTLAQIHVGGKWVNRQMVELGLAWRYDAYSKSPDLLAAQKSAAKVKRGLWSERSPVPPWQWRAKLRKK